MKNRVFGATNATESSFWFRSWRSNAERLLSAGNDDIRQALGACERDTKLTKETKR